MPIYLHTQNTDRSAQQTEEWLEVQDDGAITRVVTVATGATPICDSIEIMSHRNGHFAEYARNNPKASLRDPFPAPPTDTEYWAARDLICETVTKAAFEKMFASARPEI